jgi:TetR/AcrR family transcriptional regulator
VTPTLDAPAPGRTRRNRGSELVRSRLVAAAIGEFSAHGFEGASTRAIADQADAHQSQIKYHFDTKEELWRRCLDQLLAEVDIAVAEQPGVGSDDPRDVIESLIRGLVAFAAARPELNRIMMHEATSPSSRLTWLVENRLAQRRSDLLAAWNELVSTGQAAPVDADVLYHTLIGAASLLYANAPEAVLMGLQPNDPDVIQRHADGLVAMFLRPNT